MKKTKSRFLPGFLVGMLATMVITAGVVVGIVFSGTDINITAKKQNNKRQQPFHYSGRRDSFLN